MAVLAKYAELILQHAERFALLDTLCMGKPISDMLNIDVPGSAKTFAYFGELVDKIDGAVTATAQDAFHYILREPLASSVRRAVELPVDDGRLEGRPRAGRGQFGGAQAAEQSPCPPC